MNARLMIGDVRQRIKEIPDGSVDLICTSPPFLALRKYGDNPEGEMGSEATPAEFIDGLLSLTAEFRRVLAPHGSIAVELGDTFSGSGGAGGDYLDGGLREGQPTWEPPTTRANGAESLSRGSSASGAATNAPRTSLESSMGVDAKNRGNTSRGTARRKAENPGGWPLAKSLCLTPFAYPMALAYGRNPLTGQPSPAGQWMVRNMIAWARPNPPVGDLADKVRPGTSYITVATTSPRRWFDLDAVRTEHTVPNGGPMRGRAIAAPRSSDFGNEWDVGERLPLNPAGAPPLDWWDDDYDPADPVDAYTLGHMTLVQATQPYKGWTTIARQVPCGPDDGGERTTSPDCPVHADLPGQLPKALRDARAGGRSKRTARTDAGHVQEQLLGSVPTDPHPALGTEGQSSGSSPPPCGPSASSHSTASNRTAPAPVTTPPCTASEGTAAHTDGTPTPPSSAGDHPDTSPSSSAEACPGVDEPGTPADTDRKPDPSSACTCSYSKTEYESTSHYATWPKALAQRLILMMCPPKVCTICGVPSERITSEPEYVPSATYRGGIMKADGQRVAVGANQWVGKGGGEASVIRQVETLGWTDCGHGSWRQGCVLDPFAGSGTTLAVATGCGRDAVGIELYEANAHLIRERVGMFLEEVA